MASGSAPGKSPNLDAMARIPPPSAAYCPAMQHVVELIGRRWTGVVLHLMFLSETQRFCEIRDQVPGLSDRLLAQRLEELIAEGLVVRHHEATFPSYRLTPKGHALRPAFTELMAWTERWAPDTADLAHPGRIRPCQPNPDQPPLDCEGEIAATVGKRAEQE
jgi:DNA-binding HxlR family transcriptional regulator